MKPPGGQRMPSNISSHDREREATPIGRGEAGPGRIILAVGCSESFLPPVAEILNRDMPVQMFAVRTGGEALRVVRDREVDVILLCVGIPDLDVRDLLATLREATETATIPVLFMGKRVIDSIRHHPCRMSMDGDMEETATHAEVASWLAKRLRESTPEDRRGRLDPLTGLPNRAAFCAEFEHARAACHAAREPVTLAMLQLELQDGAAAVPVALYDHLLCAWARSLSATFRLTDYLARWNAATLVLLLPGEDIVGGTRAVERAFARCRQYILNACGAHAECLSLCAGVTSVTPGMSVAHAVASAERYLSSARSAGGNRVVSSDSRLYRRPVYALLLIDDPLMGRVISGILHQEELKVVHARSLDEARAASGGRRRFQLIVIDELLEKTQGYKALEQLKALPGTRTVPTIMLLAELSEVRIAKALELGASDYVGRPFSPLPFVSRVRRLLEHGVSLHSAPVIARRVLIIEHSLEDLILAGTTLDQHDSFIPYLAYDAKDAIERLATQPVDIVLAPLDMLKHETQGFLHLCGIPLPHDIAIVGISTGEAEVSGEAYDKRLAGVIRKPFDVLTLGRDIEELTGISATVKSTEEDSNHISDEIQRVLTLFGPPAGSGSQSERLMRSGQPGKKTANVRLARSGEAEAQPKWKWL